MDFQQVHGNAMEPGTWVLATYEDTAPRVVYMCACGKVNAIDRGRLDEDGNVVDAAGLPDEIACEKKGCDHKHALKFLEGTPEEMNDHRDQLQLRHASHAALVLGVTSDSLASAETAKAEAAAAVEAAAAEEAVS